MIYQSNLCGNISYWGTVKLTEFLFQTLKIDFSPDVGTF